MSHSPEIETKAGALRGAAALLLMLDCIGESDGDGDHSIAKLLVENELPLRDLLEFAAQELAEWCKRP